MAKPNVLVAGGCGFIGRNVVHYLISNDCANHVRIVDKVPPQVAWLNEKHSKVFNDARVDFKSANLINPDSCANAFAPPEGDPSGWDYVINCAGETKPSQTDPVYREGIQKLSTNCAKQAAQIKAKHYVEISSAQVYSSDKDGHKETARIDPWTFIGKWKHEAEKEIAAVPDLKYTILRPALVYGSGDRTGLTPRLMIGAIYKQLGETMKLLWSSDLYLNTVHVDDLCKAVWFVCQRDDTLSQVYNVVDKGDTTQGSLSDILCDLYAIKVDYLGNMMSNMVELNGAADEANDKHLEPWAQACQKDGVINTPLSPHMDAEHLANKNLRINGQKLEALGFQIEHEKPNGECLKTLIREYIDMKVFPKSLAP